jgi:hypothetical protein
MTSPGLTVGSWVGRRLGVVVGKRVGLERVGSRAMYVNMIAIATDDKRNGLTVA